jgi:hypothetical protein
MLNSKMTLENPSINVRCQPMIRKTMKNPDKFVNLAPANPYKKFGEVCIPLVGLAPHIDRKYTPVKSHSDSTVITLTVVWLVVSY